MVQVIEIHLEYKFDTDVTLVVVVVVVRTFFTFLENSWLWKEIDYESESAKDWRFPPYQEVKSPY